MMAFTAMFLCFLCTNSVATDCIVAGAYPERQEQSALGDYLVAAKIVSSTPELRNAIASLEGGEGCYLARARNVERLGSRALEHMLGGNTKPWKPGAPSIAEIFPTVDFRKLGLVVAASAYVFAADGQPKRAVSALAAGLAFGDRISRTSIPCYSAGSAIISSQLKMFATLGKRFDVVALVDADSALRNFIALRPRLAEATSRNYQMVMDVVNLACSSNWAKWMEADGEDESLRLSQLTHMADSELAEVRRKTRLHIQTRASEIAGILELPINQWYMPHPLGELDLPGLVALKLVSIDDDYIVMEQIMQIRARLCLVNIMAQRYVWDNLRSPRSLDEMNDRAATTDPLTGEPFLIEATGSGLTYFSRGNALTGPIRIDPVASGT